MKFLIAIVFLVFAVRGATQSSDRSFITDSAYFIDSTGAKENISAATVSTFNKMFGHVENVRWHATEDGSNVKFEKNHTSYLVFYNRKGRWQSTIQYLPNDMMPEWVVGRVKSDFPKFSIFFAQYVKSRAGAAYLVKIEKGNEWKFVSITPLTTEVIGEYVRN